MATPEDKPVEATSPEPTIQLPNGTSITYEEAINTDSNVLQKAQYVAADAALTQTLYAERPAIAALVRHHLGLADSVKCIFGKRAWWMKGAFNVCIPVDVRPAEGPRQTLMFRCAMPHKLAEAHSPGSIDEKMSCEVGAYAWMQAHCPDVRIPHLYGFGFSDQRHFTHEKHRSFLARVFYRLRSLVHRLLGRSSLLSRYTSHLASTRLPTAYMVLEFIESDDSQMLSATWDKHRGDPVRTKNLYRGIARTMLSLSRVPQPRIGSFEFHDDGSVTLSNRPSLWFAMILENEGTPVMAPRGTTYTTTEL